VGTNAPDLTLILDIPAEAGLKRAAKRRGKRGADRFEAEALAFHQTLRRAFLDIARGEPQRCAVIDALKSQKDVAADIWATVEARLDPAGALQRSAG
jgi:dTMP kinase